MPHAPRMSNIVEYILFPERYFPNFSQLYSSVPFFSPPFKLIKYRPAMTTTGRFRKIYIIYRVDNHKLVVHTVKKRKEWFPLKNSRLTLKEKIIVFVLSPSVFLCLCIYSSMYMWNFIQRQHITYTEYYQRANMQL